ncbi:MAG: NAD-dependent epimerase/dehydratase family protein [Chloroflexi bacterium]|nr:NAD-dependent epimerase/dehydratase family protein [Chloroflexota bacterium]
MRHLVTGGAGFIGSHIVRALLDAAEDVRVLDDFSTGKPENLSGMKVELIEGDLRDIEAVSRAVQGIDIIFHEAAFVSVPESLLRPIECFDVNVNGTTRLLDMAKHAGVKRVVIASSAAVYGDTDLLPLEEQTPLRPLSPYALSKHMDEMLAELYTNILDLEVTALRYFNVYGPRQRPDSMYAAVIPIFIRRMLDGQPAIVFGDGLQTRDLINVHDVVRANLIASRHPAAAGQVFNICTGSETTILDLLDALYRILPDAPRHIHEETRAGDIYHSVGAPVKASALLGFKASIGLELGLIEALEAMRAGTSTHG